MTTEIIHYYLFEVEVEFHGCEYLVSEDIGVGWLHDSSRSLFELLTVTNDRDLICLVIPDVRSYVVVLIVYSYHFKGVTL